GGAVRLWDTLNQKIVDRLQLNEAVYSVSASSKGNWYAVGTRDGMIGIWRGGAALNKIIVKGTGDKQIPVVAASHEGKLVAWGQENGDVFVFDVQQDLVSRHFHGNPDYVSTIVPLLDTRNVAIVFESGRTQLWKTDAGEPGALSPLSKERG